MTEQITTRVRQRRVFLGIQGAPEVKNRFGSGTMRPTEVQITYWYDGSDPARPDGTVRLFGLWTRENGEQTDHVMDQNYDGPHHNWPEWLVDIVRANQPKP